MKEKELKSVESEIKSYVTPQENRILRDRRITDKRQSNLSIEFTDRRIGENRKENRRTRKSSKSLHNLIRFLKENEVCPYEKIYEQPMGIEALQDGKRYINMSLVDYYNFAQNEEIKQVACKAIIKYGAGAFSARHSYGYLSILKELEENICDFMKKESVLIFNSGYIANLAIIDSLLGKDPTIFLDQHSHISLYHACKLSHKKSTFRYANNDLTHLESFLKTHADSPNKWIVTLGTFSSTGILGNLKDIVYLAKKYKSRIFIDDAHGIGIYGKDLRGVADLYDVLNEIDLIMCSFQMAFGNIGAFVVGKKHILQPAHYEALPYIFTYALPPVNTISILKALDILNKDGQILRMNLWNNVNYFRSKLIEIGYKIINSNGHIISIYTGDELVTCKFSKFLFNKGIWIQSYVHPFAPKGNGIVRITCTSQHTKNIIDQILPSFSEAFDIIVSGNKRMRSLAA